uniref:Uncharacterized protein n=1 Tax=Rhizophora mucronata TaxID=61149 RepID=A0A2P2P481_RHIMU
MIHKFDTELWEFVILKRRNMVDKLLISLLESTISIVIVVILQIGYYHGLI